MVKVNVAAGGCKWCAMGECWSHSQTNKPGKAKGKGAAPKQAHGSIKASIKTPITPSKTLKKGQGKGNAIAQPRAKVHAQPQKAGKGSGKSVKSGVINKFANKVALVAKAQKGKKDCKWCLEGECWSHGQVAKPTVGGKAAKFLRPKAKVAMSSKFSKLAQNMQGAKGGGKGAKGGGKGQWQFVPNGGVKKPMLKQSHVVQQHASTANPKIELNAALAWILERSITKEDCAYEVTEENGKHIAVLTIAALPTERTEFKGKPAAGEQEAIRNAAQKALNCLSKEINEARAKRDEKRKEKAAERKDKQDAKRAEKEAAAAA